MKNRTIPDRPPSATNGEKSLDVLFFVENPHNSTYKVALLSSVASCIPIFFGYIIDNVIKLPCASEITALFITPVSKSSFSNTL